MGPGETMSVLISIVVPTLFLLYVFKRWFSYKEMQLEVEARAAEAAQPLKINSDLEQRVRVLEQIVTDRGADTAAQIEALRKPRLSRAETTDAA